MQPKEQARRRTDAVDEAVRTPPGDMPSTVPSRESAMRGAEKPRDVLPQQRPVTDDELTPPKPAKWKTLLGRILAAVLAVVALAFAYVFLLVGEPDEEAKNTPEVVQEQIRMPMNALEIPGDANLQSLADTFGQPVLTLYGSALTMQKARVVDTAFDGGYARRVTLLYAFPDGMTLALESIRPTHAITLLSGSGYTLDANSLYGLGGINAARMDSAQQICVFGQSGTAAYVLLCPITHQAELNALLRQTALVLPAPTEN